MIRNFIYLDEEKMYSLSSQVFAGVTEYVLDESFTESETSEQQKGPLGSGKILGDILKRSDRNSEKKFLNDYSYTLFEEELLRESRVVKISYSDRKKDLPYDNKPFIKATSRVTFNDINSIKDTLENFNKIGEALAHVTNFEKISAAREQMEKARTSTKDRNEKSRLQAQFKSLTNIAKLAKDSGLRQDQGFLDDLNFLLSYGFQDQLEVQMNLDGRIISANLNRSYLRENEDLIIRKYSRQTEVEFTLFGIITQCQREEVEESEEPEEFNSLKEALMNLVSHLTYVEATFTGCLSHEIIVDPIALYTEL